MAKSKQDKAREEAIENLGNNFIFEVSADYIFVTLCTCLLVHNRNGMGCVKQREQCSIMFEALFCNEHPVSFPFIQESFVNTETKYLVQTPFTYAIVS